MGHMCLLLVTSSSLHGVLDLRARASGLTAMVLLCEVLQEGHDLGCAVKEQGETSVLHSSMIQEEGGAACFPHLDGAHPRLAQPTFPLGLLRSFA